MEKRFIELMEEALERDSGTVLLEDEFRKYEEWDSLAHLSIVAMLDQQFNLVIERTQFDNIKTVGQLLSIILKHGVLNSDAHSSLG